MKKWFPKSKYTLSLEEKEGLHRNKTAEEKEQAEQDEEAFLKQIQQLQFIPRKARSPEHFRGSYKDTEKNPPQKIITEKLNPEWVADMFEKEFFGFVRVQTPKWISIPMGNSRNETAPKDLLTTVPCAYEQGKKNFCLFYSLASALHYVGYVQEAKLLAQQAEAADNLEPTRQRHILKEKMRLICPSIGTYQSFGILSAQKKKIYMSKKNLIREKTIYPTVVLPEASDFQITHAVCVVDDLIFDSTQKYAMKLKAESFNWICGTNLTWRSVMGAMRFCQKMDQSNPPYQRELIKNWN
jgi:hypothetical protein